MTGLAALSDSRQAGGLSSPLEQSDVSGCETPNRPYLMRTDASNKTVYFIRPECGQWKCKYCAQERKKSWYLHAAFGGDSLLRAGMELSFVTLTSHRLVRSLTAGIAVWRDAWPKLSARWRRASPGLQYIWMSEHGEVGHFHAHLITTATLPTRWYKDNSAETGLGYKAEAERIHDGRQCGGYMTKYLTKALASGEYPKGYRRVNTSRRWPKVPKYVSPYKWRMIGTDDYDYDQLHALYSARGWLIRDTVYHSG